MQSDQRADYSWNEGTPNEVGYCGYITVASALTDEQVEELRGRWKRPRWTGPWKPIRWGGDGEVIGFGRHHFLGTTPEGFKRYGWAWVMVPSGARGGFLCEC